MRKGEALFHRVSKRPFFGSVSTMAETHGSKDPAWSFGGSWSSADLRVSVPEGGILWPGAQRGFIKLKDRTTT